MQQRVAEWFERSTSSWRDWDAAELVAAKAGRRVSLVIPARNEQATIGGIVERIRAELVDAVPLVDELVVIDSDSDDDTGAEARAPAPRCTRARHPA